VSDELAEAKRFLRSEMSELSQPVGGETDTRDLWLVMREYDRRGEAFRTMENRLDFAERRLKELDTALSPLCLCDPNPETTDGPQRECPLHGDGATFVAEYDRRGRIEKAATAVVGHWRGLSDVQLIRIERAAKVELPDLLDDLAIAVDLLDDLVTAVDRPWQGAAAHPWRQCEPPIEINLKSSGTWRCPCGKKWVLSVNASGPTPYFVWTEMGQVSEDD